MVRRKKLYWRRESPPHMVKNLFIINGLALFRFFKLSNSLSKSKVVA